MDCFARLSFGIIHCRSLSLDLPIALDLSQQNTKQRGSELYLEPGDLLMATRSQNHLKQQGKGYELAGADGEVIVWNRADNFTSLNAHPGSTRRCLSLNFQTSQRATIRYLRTLPSSSTTLTRC